jgi:hypothetical protein
MKYANLLLQVFLPCISEAYGIINGMKNYINEGIEPEVREIDDYVISVSFDKNWLCFEAQIIDRKNAELYFESGPSRESAFTNSMRLIETLNS